MTRREDMVQRESQTVVAYATPETPSLAGRIIRFLAGVVVVFVIAAVTFISAHFLFVRFVPHAPFVMWMPEIIGVAIFIAGVVFVWKRMVALR